MRRRTPDRARVVALLVLGFAIALPDLADCATQLQGYYEAFQRGTREDETWQFDLPNHYLELRVLSSPLQNVEGFVEVSASSNRFRTVSPGVDLTRPNGERIEAFVHDPEVFFNEGHLKFRTRRTELLFFSGQNRFWFSQPLLQIVDGGTLQDDLFGPRSQAVRVDFWDFAGFRGLAYYGDKHTNGEDFVAGRVLRTFSQNRAVLGTTFGHKNYRDDNQQVALRNQYDLTWGVDAELALGELIRPVSAVGRTTLVVEAAKNFSGWLEADEDLTSGIQTELRDVQVRNFTFKGNAWYREPFLYTGLSSRAGDNDRKGYFLEAWYRIPRKQIDVRYAHWNERALQQIAANGEIFSQNEHSLETYLELKGGISAWVKWRRYETNNNLIEQVFKNLIFELQAQNSLISVRPQVRFRDYGTPFEVRGYGMEINLNATSTWKFFARFLAAEENTESRRTVFLQTRYSGFRDAEFFIEYGDGGRSDRLTENDFWIGEGPSAVDQNYERRIQAFFKLWF